MGTALWWAGNAVLAFVALPAVLVASARIIGSLRVVKSAAFDIANSAEAISSSVPAAMAEVARVADACGELEAGVLSSAGGLRRRP